MELLTACVKSARLTRALEKQRRSAGDLVAILRTDITGRAIGELWQDKM
jgi:hypothetical protein